MEPLALLCFLYARPPVGTGLNCSCRATALFTQTKLRKENKRSLGFCDQEDHPDLEQIDPAVLKYCHAAAATCIVEAGKQKADKSAISTYLEDCKFDRERIEQFCTEYQVFKPVLPLHPLYSITIVFFSTGRCPPHITDICWRLEYQIKTNQLHKNYRPTYLMTLNIEVLYSSLASCNH
ncbi:hypothetical protein JD844_003299 [Phrynosoma platyrhinos]|uniref:COMM domain-containing protein 3 n=1 Tax=Phrynosoma platyrhinos TaxID=52577 RepID=A0ABQ7TCY8_PHRPL|nr:hypothetical protein JD844_003299 [Phrynosoma platyrhinos]